MLRKLLSATLMVGAAILLILLLGAAVWKFDPPVRSNLAGGAVISWHRSGVPSEAREWTWLFVKMDDGRTVRVSSERTAQPTVGERVRVQERAGLFGTRKFYEMPN